MGSINTNGEWVKVSLDISSFSGEINESRGFDNVIAFKYGKEGTYNLLIDDVTVE